ncbi:MAG: hypothetical protein NTY35_15075, partial [Planctomycetota bacterium]|nr:hypothetical protein [Planctomycetota bacterium]
MAALESIWTALLACAACALVPAGAAARDLQTRTWDARDPAVVARVLAAERGAGPAAAQRALDGFAPASVAERRVRAQVLRAEYGPEQLSAVLALTADPDALVRAELVRAIARPDQAGLRNAERAGALTRLADADADPEVRAAARDGLASLAAAGELARLADGAPRSERAALLV